MVNANTWPRPQINFDTDRATVVLFPAGAGGKFLINVLGMATNAAMQSDVLTSGIASGRLTNNDKRRYIDVALEEVKGRWDDLGLGATVALGVDELVYLTDSPDTRDYWPWYAGIDRLTNSGTRFFIDTHVPATLEAILKVWPHAGIIVIEDCDQFLHYRGVHRTLQELVTYWQSVRGPDWPIDPPYTWDDYQKLDVTIREELELMYDNEIFRHISHPVSQKAINQSRQEHLDRILNTYSHNVQFRFSGSAWLDWQQTRWVIEQCYTRFDLEDLDLDFVRSYYTRWIDLITQVKI